MRRRIVHAAAIVLTISGLVWSSPAEMDAPDEKASIGKDLKLKTKPACDSDPEDPILSEALQWSRRDLTVTLRLRVAASGIVEAANIVETQPAGDQLAERWGKSLTRCWRSASYDTQGLEASAFPMDKVVKATWKAARDSQGRRKD